MAVTKLKLGLKRQEQACPWLAKKIFITWSETASSEIKKSK